MTSNNRGIFIAFEGGDGAGKSTQSEMLADWLRNAGHEVVQTREPGGTDVSERLRSIVLEHGHGAIDSRTEALIFAAARAAHVHQLIQPMLEQGKHVITDRFVDSSIAYQGAGRSLGTESVALINDFATEGLRPDLTVLLDISAHSGRARRLKAGEIEDRLELEKDEFHERIRQEFLSIAQQYPQNYLVVDADLPTDEQARLVQERIRGFFP